MFAATRLVNAESDKVRKADNKQLYAWTAQCLVEASNSNNQKQQKKVLTWASNHLKQVRTRIGSNPQLDQAIDDVQTALEDVKNHVDASTIKQDINQALQVVDQLISNEDGAAATTASPTPPTTGHPAPTVKLTEDQAAAIVLIKGDNGEGTGFLVKTKDGPVVVTNQHVIANNPNLKITTNTGAELTVLSYKAATDRDLAMIAIKDGAYSYLTLATDVSGTVQPGDEVITPGNSQGGDVVLNTDGKVLGIGPDRIEFDNPVYHGNSGGPVFDVKTKQVIGVVTSGMKVDTSNELDRASFANRNSAITHSVRYFGLRVDNVPSWEAIDWRQYLGETAFLDAFDLRSRALDSFLNAPNDDKPEDTVWKQDDKIVNVNNEFFSQTAGADTGQQMDAVRQLYSDLHDIANTDAATIANPSNFYTYDRQRAKDEIAYRKALQAELDQFDKDVSRMGSLPRSNR